MEWGEWKWTYLDLRLVSSCWIAWIRDVAACFSYVTFSIPVELVSVMLVVTPWKPAEEMTPPVPAFIFWSTLVWLLVPWPSFTCRFGVGVMGDARPSPCWISGLARWAPGWLFVKCWYKLPSGGTDDDEDIAGGAAGACWCWTWLVTIVETVELWLLLLLLLFVVGNWIPGTVVADDNGTDTTRLSGCCCCWRSSFDPPLSFAWMFCVITCDLLLAPVVGEVTVEADDDALVTVVVPVEWITFGFTFWMFGSWGGAVAAAGVDCEFKSVRA